MTDLLLAAVVLGAVMAFGALISIGNERQRRAIDAIHLESHIPRWQEDNGC